MLQRRGAPAHAAGFKLLKSKNGQRVNQPVCTGGVVVLEIVHREDFQFDKERKKKRFVTSVPGINIRLACVTPQVDSKVLGFHFLRRRVRGRARPR